MEDKKDHTENNKYEEYDEYTVALVDLTPTRGHKLSLANPSFWTTLYPGAQIAVAFRKYGLIAWHHGIYIGDGNVIDNNQHKGQPSIQQRTMQSFIEVGDINHSVVMLIEYENDNEEVQKLTVQLAHSLMNSSYNIHTELYNVFAMNCETFATFCRTGKFRCELLLFINALFNKHIDEILFNSISSKTCNKGQNKLKRQFKTLDS